MGRVLVIVLVVVVIAIVAARSRARARRKADTTPELHKHPERLDQNLDPTDDA
jgi:heme/copper-type cytochrome/quinol oxidase subunit 2